jgi:hypothetical protein
MLSPLFTAKRSVDLTAAQVRASRVRRDPPPPQTRKLSPRDRDERDHRRGVIGIVAVALMLFAITLGLPNAAGWSPRQYVIRL